MLQAAKGDRLQALYTLAVTTGMRQGELLGLGWEDLDLESGTVRVRRTLTLAKGGPRLTEPKTRGSRRSIRLTAGAVEALETNCQRQAGRTRPTQRLLGRTESRVLHEAWYPDQA